MWYWEVVGQRRFAFLLNTFQQAIQFYAIYFYKVGLRCKGIDKQSGQLIISKEEYANVQYQMDRIHELKYNGKRYEVLTTLGIRICENGDVIHIVHNEYKQAMEGLLYLCSKR